MPGLLLGLREPVVATRTASPPRRPPLSMSRISVMSSYSPNQTSSATLLTGLETPNTCRLLTWLL